jgi:2-polyprenyl-3-methyl-5-hydroxy-6-metoxy-1,4-benzoquinol methylase
MPQESSAAHASRSDDEVGYPLGSSGPERQRLVRQAQALHAITLDAFRAAGLAPGMRVLDIGCGAGDVAMLAANLVGPTGAVVALDRDPENLAFARARAAQANLTNIDFRQSEIAQFTDPKPFDAIVGRYILLFLPDRAGVLRHLMQFLRSGGLVTFVEPDFSLPFRSEPFAPLYSKATEWARAVIRASNVNMDSGPALLRVFREAGLAGTRMDCRTMLGGGTDCDVYELFTAVVRSMLPAIEAHKIATGEEVDIDTLEQRIRAEAVELGSVLFGYATFAAWAIKS